MKALRTAAILAILIGTFGAQLLAEPVIDLDQKWSDKDLKAWYDGTQGSRLIPLDWLLALEQPDAISLFIADEHIAKFRYLPRPGKLPIGFALDDTSDDQLSVTRLRWRSDQKANEKWVGLNCAACHTSQITYRGSRVRVEGGPALADFQDFIETLNSALVQTRDQPDKFDRFAGRALATSNNKAADRELLKKALSDLIEWQLKVERMNATDLRYGYGRLDAFGHIFNKVVLVANPPEARLEPLPSDAPVSYPFLWNVPQQTFVQWNASAPNREFRLQKVVRGHKFQLRIPVAGQLVDTAALGRNTGEVIGVFADIMPSVDAKRPGYDAKDPKYKSSIRLESLVSMEQMLKRLRPPAWPVTLLGKPERDSVARGKTLFKQNCEMCHAAKERADLESEIKITRQQFGPTDPYRTDPTMTCNAYMKQAPTGVLENSASPRDNHRLKEKDGVRDMLGVAIAGAINDKQRALGKSILLSLLDRQPPPETIPYAGAGRLPERPRNLPVPEDCSGAFAYKARPLNGIWATAPYLHNGSVPTLYDLLRPAEERPESFYVGSREFDPEKVGFVTTKSTDNSFLFHTRGKDGNLIKGNSNEGHGYGTRLDRDEKKALLEYLKTL